ncbi:hypothetical protein NKH18_02130 [Streptomyces sp. M10(2022)]
MGSMVTQAIRVAAELRIAEALQDGPLRPEEIAGRVGANAGVWTGYCDCWPVTTSSRARRTARTR